MMTPERWARIDDVFHRALDLTPAEREKLLATSYADDLVLQDEVRQLLAAHEATGPLARAPENTNRTPPLEWIGPYRLIRKLGEGGMGVVHLAERSGDGFTQVVALKLIRAGFAVAGLEARLAEERRILARLDHPGIARFIDGGSTATGQPYVAMEYVEGVDLLQYCKDRGLTLRQRLSLFAEICDAVHYAHQQLVVHRDLKPGNILVTNDGRPKLLDFGLAKVLEDDGSQDATQTSPWVTPAYASPEQLRRGRISTLTDVYALGVVLYELLTDRRPHDLNGLPPAEMVRVVCESVPAPPSGVAIGGDAAATDRLRPRIDGDLDVITLKALAKEPQRRYGSACELAEDTRRYLAGRPVLARPDSVWYRASKFVARHRASVAAAVAVVLMLITGLAFSVWQAREARLASERAEIAKRQSDDVASFLLNLFQASDPNNALGDTLAAREILRRGAVEAGRLGAQPALQARMFDALGLIYDRLGRYGEAEQLLQRSLSIRRSTLGANHVDVATSLDHLGMHYRQVGSYARAESLYRKSLAMKERLLGPEDPEIAETLALLGFLMPYVARLDEAEAFYQRAVDMRRRTLPASDDRISEAMVPLASHLARRGRLDEAEAMLRDAVQMRRTAHGDGDPRVADVQVYLADFLTYSRPRYAEAESLYREVLAAQQREYGDRHLRLTHAVSNLADALERQGKLAEAERRLRDVLEINLAAFGPRHPSTTGARAGLAQFFHRQKRDAEAESLFRQTLSEYQTALGADHGLVAGAKADLATFLVDVGRYAEADSLYLQAMTIREKLSGPRHGHIAGWLVGRARIMTAARRYAEAESALVRALGIAEPQMSDAMPPMQHVLQGFVDLYKAAGRPQDAERYIARLNRAASAVR